ncbi:MAG: hypothetical protein J2O49_02560 [Sciscionella sp.]|nr:hypothetical protein [Sciscionella sp.]
MSDHTAGYRMPEQTERLTPRSARPRGSVDEPVTSTMSPISIPRTDEPPASPAADWPSLRGQLPIESLGPSVSNGNGQLGGLSNGQLGDHSQGQLHDHPRARLGGRRGYLVKGLGLLGIAIASGVLWWAFRHHPANQDVGGGQPAGKYSFSQAHSPLRDSDCAGHSYGATKKLFERTPCVTLVQTLYSTTVHGTKLFSSVSVVQMRNVADAAKLEQLTQQDGTGNVSDVLTEKAVIVPDAPKSLADGGFEATRDGSVVTIVESGPAVGEHASNDLLKDVSQDALRLGGATAIGS